MSYNQNKFDFITRPVLRSRKFSVTSGHYLSSLAGIRILEQGGNAIDAAAATSFCLNIIRPDNNGIAGEVPTLVYSAKDKKVFAISGVGWSAKSFNIDWCKKNNVDIIPGDGYLPATVPAPVGTWALALARFGTMGFSEVLQPAIELAENGFPIHEQLQQTLNNYFKSGKTFPTTDEIFCPNGIVPDVGDRIVNIDAANTLKKLCLAEKKGRKRSRITGLEAATDAFYRGEIAETIIDFIHKNPVEDISGRSFKGMLDLEDFSEWHATIEEPEVINFRGLDVFKCPSWTQGPTFLQHLAILDTFDLEKIGHNTEEYLHILIESGKLAFADREAYYGDPDFDNVPLDVLLSKSYNLNRKESIKKSASMEMSPGLVSGKVPDFATSFDVISDNRKALGLDNGELPDFDQTGIHTGGDTVHLDTVDSFGNMVSSTPSGGWLAKYSPVIKGLGFPLGTRGQMFYLNPSRPNALSCRKRPRATLTPGIATKDGLPYLAFGTPGGDSQEQTTIQFFLNHHVFGMNLQEAIDAPNCVIEHFPSSFYPREGIPGGVTVDGRVPQNIIDGLKNRGHKVKVGKPYSVGEVSAISLEAEKEGLISSAASAHGGLAYAISR